IISAPRSGLLERNPALATSTSIPEPKKVRSRLGDQPCDFNPTTCRDRIAGNGVLEYGPTEILPRVGALLAGPAAICRPRRQTSRAHPRGKPGFSTLERGCGRETDSPLEEAGFEPSVPREKTRSSRGFVRPFQQNPAVPPRSERL